MGGGGGSGPLSRSTDYESLRERAQRTVTEQALLADVNEVLGRELTEINHRDTEQIGRYLDDVLNALGDDLEDVRRLLYGGSVAKHTYVDGLSDVDALVVLKAAPEESPADVRDAFAETLRDRLPRDAVAEVASGTLAVTITYRDGNTIQIIPAVQREGHVAIPSADAQSWQAIHPRTFARELTSVNESNQRLVVPTIKLAKSLIGQFPEDQRLSGYHVEALAVEAFSHYDGPYNYADTLKRFFSYASQRVLRPIQDVTGQSVNLDDSLGSADSESRRRAASSLARITRRMESATSVDDWRRLLDE